MSSKKPSLLALHPSDKLQFELSGDGVGPKCVLKLTNTSSSRLAFKVKTTHRNRYLVRPNQALLDVDGTAEVEVLIQGKAADGIVQEAQAAGKLIPSTDKFLVQVLKVPDDFYFTLIDKQSKYQSTALASMFSEVSKSDISNKKLLSQFNYPEDLFNTTINTKDTTTTTTTAQLKDSPLIEEEEEEDDKRREASPVDMIPESVASNPVAITTNPSSTSQNFTSTDLYDLQQKYEKLLLFTIELTAARDRLQKALQVKEKEIAAKNSELSSEKSKDSGGLRKRVTARDGDDKDRSMLDDDVYDVDGELMQRKQGGFTTVHIVIIAIVCFLIGRLQQTLSS